jgi:pimeloyl-ACP methyl ester carboxylesterase
MRSLYERVEPRELTLGSERLELSVVHIQHRQVGPRLLLLHGNPGTLDDFAELTPKLTFASQVLLVDLPGFGRSPKACAALDGSSLSGLANIAGALVDSFGWRTFDVVGHSHGGGVAQAMAWANPRVTNLILLGSLGFPAHTAYRQLAVPGVAAVMWLVGRCLVLPGARGWLRGVQRGIATKAFYPEPLAAERLEHDLDTILAAPTILESMVRVALGKPCAELARNATSIVGRTSFLHGDSDRLVPPRHAQHLHDLRLAAGCKSGFELMLGAGHMLLLTHAEQVADQVRSLTA